LGSAKSTAVGGLTRAVIRKLVAVPTGEDRTAIEDRDAARTTACRADKPKPFASVVAACAVQENWILLAFPVLPIPLVPVAEDNAVELRAYPDRPERLPVTRPVQVYPSTGAQEAFAFQVPNV